MLSLAGYRQPHEYGTETRSLYHGLVWRRFKDVSEKAGRSKGSWQGLGRRVSGVDRDDPPDISVANDSFPQ